MTILVTGAAGFIGFHVSRALLDRGERVIGIDDLNKYYDVTLKKSRRDALMGHESFGFEKGDIAEPGVVTALFQKHQGAGNAIDRVVNLAAQAGVRYSIDHPEPYVQTNVVGHLHVLEACRHAPGFRHLVYASSSSVYGDNDKLPFATDDPVDKPVSLYAATKRAGELMSRTYAHLYKLPQTGLRFFTVYGPWGRPDMSAYIFTRAILAGEPIRVFNNGEMRRDFTYIDDIVAGVLAALDRPPSAGDGEDGALPHTLYNLGNNRSEALMDFIAAIEDACGRQAEIRFEPMQPGDVPETYADIEASRSDLGFAPSTTIADGVPKFVAWFREYHGI